MLDKIVVLSCRKQAYMIFTDREPIGIYSDKDVTVFLRWFLDDKRVRLDTVTNMMGEQTVIGFQVIEFNDEVTIKIEIKEAS